MRNKIKACLPMVALLGIVAALTFTPPRTALADGGNVNAFHTGLMSTGTVSVAAATTITSVSTNLIPVKRDAGISIMPYFAAASGTSISNQLFGLAVTYDGTNFSTVASNLVAAIPLNGGTTAVRGYVNFPASSLNNAKYVKLWSYQNTDASVTVNVTNVTYAYFFTP